MKRTTWLLSTLASILAVLALALLAGTAEAKRLGGGGSFGSKPSYSRNYSKPVAPAPGPAQTAGAQRSQVAPQAPAPQPQGGFFSRFGLGIGGLLAGGLLGSMLFGHGGAGGMGGSGGMGLLEIALIGLAVFLAVRVFRRRAAGLAAGPARMAFDGHPADPSEASGQPGEAAGGFGLGVPKDRPAGEPRVPAGFDAPEFLAGAKAAYTRLQQAWDRRDVQDIAQFTSPEVLRKIESQAAEDPTPSRTELLLVTPSLLEVREEGAQTVASVLFDVLLREDQSEERPQQVREVWHFSRHTANPKDTWRLEGIQQLEG